MPREMFSPSRAEVGEAGFTRHDVPVSLSSTSIGPQGTPQS